MQKHGTLSDTSLDCRTMNLQSDDPIGGVLIYSSFSTITRLTIATTRSVVFSLGPSLGQTNTGIIRFEGGLEMDNFFGFTS